jgi:hypothetical protein
VIISEFKMFLEIERYVHNHYDFIIQFALYSYIIMVLNNLLVIVQKIIVWDNIMFPPIMFSPIPFFLDTIVIIENLSLQFILIVSL